MKKKDIEAVNQLIHRLETNQRVNLQEFITYHKIFLGADYTDGNCGPCLRAAINKIRAAIANNACEDCQPVVELIPTPVETTPSIEVSEETSTEKEIKTNGQKGKRTKKG